MDKIQAQVDETKEWVKSAPPGEFRFSVFFVPWVIMKEDGYLLAYVGTPPGRRRIHLAMLANVKPNDPSENVVAWVRRSGIFGLMSERAKKELEERLKLWWEDPKPVVQ